VSACHGAPGLTAPQIRPLERKQERKQEKKHNMRAGEFMLPKYIKVTPVTTASKGRNENCSFLQHSAQDLNSGWGSWKGGD
jgi:hypothetical protein